MRWTLPFTVMEARALISSPSREYDLNGDTEAVLLLLKNQEVMVRKKSEILDELESGLLGFGDDLGTRDELFRFVRGMRTVRRIIDDGQAAAGFNGGKKFAIEINALFDMVSGIAEEG